MTLPSKLISGPEHKRSIRWLRVRGAASTGKKAKRAIHRHERHLTKQQLRTQIDLLESQS